MLHAAISVWLGLLLGNWIRKVPKVRTAAMNRFTDSKEIRTPPL